MGAEAYDVNLSHSGRKIARKLGKSKGYPARKKIARSPVACAAQNKSFWSALLGGRRNQFNPGIAAWFSAIT